MITGPLKSQIDAIWDAFWSGGISNQPPYTGFHPNGLDGVFDDAPAAEIVSILNVFERNARGVIEAA